MSTVFQIKPGLITEASKMFNHVGFEQSCYEDIARVVGLSAEDAEELAIRAFIEVAGHSTARLESVAQSDLPGHTKLFYFVDELEKLIEDPPLSGGCAVWKVITDSNKKNEVVKSYAVDISNRWKELFRRVLSEAQEVKYLRANLALEPFINGIFSTLEGAYWLRTCYQKPRYTRLAFRFLRSRLAFQEKQAASPGG